MGQRGGGHYLLALKRNQASLFEQVSERIKQSKSQLACTENVDFGSGRIETRRCWVEPRLDLYDGLANWPATQSIVMIEAIRKRMSR